MKISPEERDPSLDRFTDWLKKEEIQPKPDFLSQVRQRMLLESDPADQILDQMLEMDPSLRNPHMVDLVRQRMGLEQETPRNPSLAWFSWLAPLAAAATLTLAFVSFQTRAPQATPYLSARDIEPTQVDTSFNDDFEATRIFALAANLHSSANMSQLQSVEDLASLFD